MSLASVERSRVLQPAVRPDLRAACHGLRRGTGDPTLRSDGAQVWRACGTPEGPGTLHLRVTGSEVHASAWGPGADWLLQSVPGLLGDLDDPTGFIAHHPPVAEGLRRRPHLRLNRTGLVWDALLPAILEQKVTGKEAQRSYRELVQRFGTPAPGPAAELGLRVPPSAEVCRHIASWDWHLAGVGPERSRTVVTAARVVGRLEETATWADGEAVERRLTAVRGIGPWTAAEVRQRAHGDPDAVSVGDYHLAAAVGWALLGRPVDDAQMLELLECYRPHRQRAVRYLALGGTLPKPRFGPRMEVQDLRRS